MTNARRIRVLVVDDEPLAREMIREMFEVDSDVEIVAECAADKIISLVTSATIQIAAAFKDSPRQWNLVARAAATPPGGEYE